MYEFHREISQHIALPKKVVGNNSKLCVDVKYEKHRFFYTLLWFLPLEPPSSVYKFDTPLVPSQQSMPLISMGLAHQISDYAIEWLDRACKNWSGEHDTRATYDKNWIYIYLFFLVIKIIKHLWIVHKLLFISRILRCV